MARTAGGGEERRGEGRRGKAGGHVPWRVTVQHMSAGEHQCRSVIVCGEGCVGGIVRRRERERGLAQAQRLSVPVSRRARDGGRAHSQEGEHGEDRGHTPPHTECTLHTHATGADEEAA